jgi:D-alanyl-lipoteichoic acid acyltransferase DltB (MBOAT superfamily)
LGVTEPALLFNSFAFLFLYLPVVLAGYFWLARWGGEAHLLWLALASLFFYGWWDVHFLPLLLASILFNHFAARLVASKAWLTFAVGVDLALLAAFKYADFLTGAHWHIVLPVGISFFTFTQIAYLVDCHRRKAQPAPLTQYTLFVSYFPHLIAGPVLHHGEMMPQFARPENGRLRAANAAIGLSVFVIGLAKKTLIADQLSPLAAPVFVAGAHPQWIESWIGVLAYTFQLYFDFSGYSDMAIGLSQLFGVKLPLNFNSPYKAADISEFWRRWHMTLSRFLRDYLYLPLGGNRHGALRRYRNLMLTMLLGGLWHGAAWTFVVWGGLHGVYLMAHHAWRGSSGGNSGGVVSGSGRGSTAWWSRPLTFAAVMLAWVPFRAPDLRTAADIWGALAGLNGLALPHGLQRLASLLHWLQPSFEGIRWIELEGAGLPILALAATLAFFAPNTQQLFAWHRPALDGGVRPAGTLAWSPSPRWSVALSALFLACLFSMNRVAEFLYSQF